MDDETESRKPWQSWVTPVVGMFTIQGVMIEGLVCINCVHKIVIATIDSLVRNL